MPTALYSPALPALLTVPSLIPAPVPVPMPQTIDALRYQVYTSPVDLAPLVVRQVRGFAWGAARVSAYVLGASHALTVDLGDGRTVTELLTCLPPRETGDGAAVQGGEWRIPLPGGETWQTTFAHGVLRGAVTLSRFALADMPDGLSGVFEAGDTLHEPFPTRTGEMAWTRVGWRQDGLLLYVETIHTYPEEGAGLRSETRFTLGKLTLTDGVKR